MTDTDPEVTPLAVPDRPDPDDLIASSWGRWVHDRLIAFGWTTGTFTSDANGYFNIPAASFGLATILGGIASSQFQGTAQGHTVITEVLVGTGTPDRLVCRMAQLVADTNEVNTYASAPGLKVAAFAWGTPAP